MVLVRNVDDTESGEDDERPQHEASRHAGSAASPRGAAGEREGDEGAGSRRGRSAACNADPGSSQAFAEVRALLWRREWMKSQIELLTLQREQLSQSLSRVEGEKAPILLSAAPGSKRKRQLEIPADGATPDSSAASAGGESSKTTGVHATLEAGAGVEGSGAAAAHASGDGGGYGCVREVDWEVVLGGRRRKLVQAALPLETLAQIQAESKKRYRARDFGMNGYRDSFFLGKERPKTHKEVAAARAQAVAQQAPVTDVRGNVTNGGRKLITAGGQKVIIKFSAKNPGISPRTPTPQLKNGRNGGGLTPRGAGGADTPISANKKHRTLLGLAESKMRGVGSPRMGPSHTPSHTPRDHHKQDWGLDEYVYGGPRTHTHIETVKVKEIDVPTWFVIEDDSEKKSEPDKTGGGRLSRSLAVGSKYAKAKPAARSNGHAHDESSDEDTDDDVYLKRHRPYEEQEVRFRHPKQQEREKNHKEALKKEGSVYNTAEDAYKSLWYRGDNAGEESKDSNLLGPSSGPFVPPSPLHSALDKVQKSPRGAALK